MSKYVYVVTSLELGWDCIVAVYDNEQAAERHASSGDSYVMHYVVLEKEFFE